MGWGYPGTPESGVSVKCHIHSVCMKTPHHFSPWDKAYHWGTGPTGPVGNWTAGQETRLSQRRTEAYGTEGLTTRPSDTGDEDYDSKNTPRAAVLLPVYKHLTKGSRQSFSGTARVSTETGSNYRL